MNSTEIIDTSTSALDRSTKKPIRLEPMTESQFRAYEEYGIQSFARNAPRFRGVDHEIAIRQVREEFNTKILPQGMATPGHFLWSIFHNQTHVGFLHLGEMPRVSSKDIFAWDFVIFEPHRRKGFARLAMEEAGKKLKELGYRRVGLNVFEENLAATHLYKAMGFKTTQIQMMKDLD